MIFHDMWFGPWSLTCDLIWLSSKVKSWTLAVMAGSDWQRKIRKDLKGTVVLVLSRWHTLARAKRLKDWKTPTTGLVWRHVLGESKIIWIIPGSSHNMEQFFLFAHISHHDGMMTRCDRCWYVASPVFPCRRQSSALLGRSTGRKKLGSAHGTLSS